MALAAACIALPGALAVLYRESLNGEILLWDDTDHLGEALLRAPFPEAVRSAFGASHQYVWWPLLWMSWWVQHWLGLAAPRWLHAVDLGLFLASAAVIATLLRRAGLNGWTALLATALWAVHPLRVESVAWITARKDVLSLLFAALAALAAMPRDGVPGRVRLALGHAAFACSLLAKAAVAPVAAVLWVWCWSRNGGREATRRFGGFLLLAALDWSIALFVFDSTGPVAVHDGGPLRSLGLGLWSHAAWLFHLFWPVGLAAVYPPPENPWPAAVAGLVVLAGVATWALRRARAGQRGALVLLALWFLPLLPTMGPARVAFWAADRYTLVASIAPAIAVALAVRGLRQPRAQWVVALVLIAVLAVVTHRRIPAWRDSVSLWSEDTARGPFAVRHVALAAALGARGRFGDALAELRSAEKLSPDSGRIKAHRMLAEIATRRAVPPAVIEALSSPPDDSRGWEQATAALLDAGEGELGLEAALLARRTGSTSQTSLLAEAYIYYRAGDREAAAAVVRQAAGLYPHLRAEALMSQLAADGTWTR